MSSRLVWGFSRHRLAVLAVGGAARAVPANATAVLHSVSWRHNAALFNTSLSCFLAFAARVGSHASFIPRQIELGR